MNPFRVTKHDADVFQLREEERLRRLETKKNNERLKIWQKGKSGAKAEQNRVKWIKEFISDSPQELKNEKQEEEGVQYNRVGEVLDRLEKYMNNERPEDKEMLNDFIAKKRDMFLLQMSLNIKKEEIHKLDEKARVKENALKRSEEMLEEDANRFDTFLKENDKKAQDAMREAEKESKKKIEKIQEIKKISQQLQAVHSTISKNKDGLDDCLKFKTFLDQLTPEDWFNEQNYLKSNRQRNRRRARIESRRSQWKKKQEEIYLEEKNRLENELASKQRRKRISKNKVGKDKEPAISRCLPPEPDFEDEPLTSSDEEIPMYFQKPLQLLDIFSELEEENLFLIQNTQEAEQSLDEITDHFEESKKDMLRKVVALEENINNTKHIIRNKEADIAEMEGRLDNKSHGMEKNDEDLLGELSRKVTDIYHRCGFSDAGSTPSALFMLSDIEASMENIISRIEMIPEDKIKMFEKAKEKKRRECKRAQQQADQARLQEERNRKVIERSMQPPKRRVGRPVMYRSQPIRRQSIQKERKELSQDDLDEINHLS